jgi:hypothetical protein
MASSIVSWSVKVPLYLCVAPTHTVRLIPMWLYPPKLTIPEANGRLALHLAPTPRTRRPRWQLQPQGIAKPEGCIVGQPRLGGSDGLLGASWPRRASPSV